jgi:hypothetical protein
MLPRVACRDLAYKILQDSWNKYFHLDRNLQDIRQEKNLAFFCKILKQEIVSGKF